MNRTNRTLIVLAVAVAVASIASWSIYRAVQRIPERQVEVASVYTVVATRPMPLGTVLTPDDVKLVAWPARAPIAGMITDPRVVVNRGLISPIVENEPITETKLAPTGAGGGLPPSIPAGMRAISIRVNDVIGVAGFVVPGTRVDVAVTVTRQQQEAMTRVVVSNIQVLTAGTRIDDPKKGGEPIPASVVTLMVTPEDAEKIALASTEGKIILMLRNPMDTLPTETHGVRMAALMGEAPAPAPVPKVVKGQKVMVTPKAPPVVETAAPKLYTVEAIRAAKRTEEVVR
jgi:pilus assembly protein CpaB